MREYKGMVVPWVAMWEHEVPDPNEHPLTMFLGQMDYAQPREGDRDQVGVLWVRNGLAMGSGKPLFGQIHAQRQLSCMMTPRCQVCGKRMAERTFLLADHMLQRGARAIITATPPVCIDCRDLALKLCPHLVGVSREQSLTWLTATGVGVWGYRGDVASSDGTWDRSKWVPVKGDPDIQRTLAKQIVLAITDWTEEPWPNNSPTTASTPS